MESAEPYTKHLQLTAHRQPRQHLITQLFMGWMLFLMPKQLYQNIKSNNMLICWFVNTSFKQGSHKLIRKLISPVQD